MDRAVVVECSRMSYLIDVLGMLKVEGSKHGISVNLYIEKYFSSAEASHI